MPQFLSMLLQCITHHLLPLKPSFLYLLSERSDHWHNMAGLSVLLETKNSLPKYTNILCKTSLAKNSSSSCSTSPFLENCYLCRKKLQQGKDIYMYRGDRAFCSEECRRKQIFMDEESVRGDQCSVSAAAAAAGRGRARRMAGKGEVTLAGRSAC